MAAQKTKARASAAPVIAPQSTISNLADSYLELMETSAPKAKQAADDLFGLWLSAARAVFSLEKSALRAVGVSPALLQKGEDLFTQTAAVAEETQKIASSASLNASLKTVAIVRSSLTSTK